MNVLGIDAGGTQTVCLLADDSGTRARRSARPGRESAGGRRAGSREGPARRHRAGRWRRSSAARGDLPRHGRRRSAARRGDRSARSSSASATRAQVLVVNDALIALEAGVPGARRHRRDRRHRIDRLRPRRARPRGARRRLGLRARRRGQRLLARPAGAARRRACRRRPRRADRITERVLAHYGVARPQDLVREIYEGGCAADGDRRARARSSAPPRRTATPSASDLVASARRDSRCAAASVARRLGIEREPVRPRRAACCAGSSRCAASLTADLSRRCLTRRRPAARRRAGARRRPAGAGRCARQRCALPAYVDAV